MPHLLLLLVFLLGCALAVGAEEKSAEFYVRRGFEYGKRKEHDLAIADFNKALELNPREKAYDKAWKDVHKAQSFGWKVTSDFLKKLRRASGRYR